MRRYRCRRKLGVSFKDLYFKPSGIPMRNLEQVELSKEELETLRLRYKEGETQADAAKKMNISQSQYQRDLWAAHKKITDALVSGKAIKINTD